MLFKLRFFVFEKEKIKLKKVEKIILHDSFLLRKARNKNETLVNPEKLLYFLYPKHKIIDKQSNYDAGHPDFKIISPKNKVFYVEIKNNYDKIQKNQIDWVKNNNKKVIFLFIKPD